MSSRLQREQIWVWPGSQGRVPAERKFSWTSVFVPAKLVAKNFLTTNFGPFRATFPEERGQAKFHQTFFTGDSPHDCTKKIPAEVLKTLFWRQVLLSEIFCKRDLVLKTEALSKAFSGWGWGGHLRILTIWNRAPCPPRRAVASSLIYMHVVYLYFAYVLLHSYSKP